MTGPAIVPLRVVLADDEPLARERLKRLLERAGPIDLVGEAANGTEALELIESLQPDLVLLDIQMPGATGLRVLEALDDPPAVIFTTAYDEYAVKAFELEAVDYILKPFSAERLRKAIDRARRLLDGPAGRETPAGDTPGRLAAQNGLATELVPFDRIVAFRIEENVVFLFRDDGESLICSETLNELESMLPAERFFRASRQAILAIGAIQSFEKTEDGGMDVQLSAGLRETVSRRRARHLRARLGVE